MKKLYITTRSVRYKYKPDIADLHQASWVFSTDKNQGPASLTELQKFALEIAVLSNVMKLTNNQFKLKWLKKVC